MRFLWNYLCGFHLLLTREKNKKDSKFFPSRSNWASVGLTEKPLVYLELHPQSGDVCTIPESAQPLWIRKACFPHVSIRWRKVRPFPEQAHPLPSVVSSVYLILFSSTVQESTSFCRNPGEGAGATACACSCSRRWVSADPSRALSCHSFDFVKELALPRSQKNILYSFYGNPRNEFSGTRALFDSLSKQSCPHSWSHSLDLAGLHSEKCDFWTYRERSWAGKMAERLRALAALAEGHSSVPSIHLTAYEHL